MGEKKNPKMKDFDYTNGDASEREVRRRNILAENGYVWFWNVEFQVLIEHTS